MYLLCTRKLTTLKPTTKSDLIEIPSLKTNHYLYREQFMGILPKIEVSQALKQYSKCNLLLQF